MQRQLLSYYITSLLLSSILCLSPAYGQENTLQAIDDGFENAAPADNNAIQSGVPSQADQEIESAIDSAMQSTSADGFVPSFGNFSKSLMFEPADLAKFLAIIQKVEKRKSDGLSLTDEQLTELVDEPEVVADIAEEEPIIFPYYHLASIVYGSPKHWMVRVNGITITAKNNMSENELYVAAINDKSASFIWRPQDKRLLGKLAEINPTNLEVEHAQTITHRINRKGYTPRLFSDGGYVQFTLEPNQLFYSEYMTIYEGSAAQIVPPPPPLETEEELLTEDMAATEEQRRSLEEATAPTEENFPILGILPEPPKRSIITEPPPRPQ